MTIIRPQGGKGRFINASPNSANGKIPRQGGVVAVNRNSTTLSGEEGRLHSEKMHNKKNGERISVKRKKVTYCAEKQKRSRMYNIGTKRRGHIEKGKERNQMGGTNAKIDLKVTVSKKSKETEARVGSVRIILMELTWHERETARAWRDQIESRTRIQGRRSRRKRWYDSANSKRVISEEEDKAG